MTEKLTRVFGDRRAAELLSQLLAELSLARVATVEDLTRVAGALQARGGFEGATGAMLAVRAQMLRLNGS